MLERRRRTTSADVAAHAGVSRSAVSRTFTPGASVSTETRERVLRSAKELGYRRNALARSLTTNSTDLVAVVIGYLSSQYEPYFLSRLTAGLQRMHKRALLVNIEDDDDVDVPLLEALSYPVEAVVVAAGSISPGTAEECLRLGIPLVLSGRALAADGVDAVCCDNRHGARLAADALVKGRHERIAYLGGRQSIPAEIERSQGFAEGLAANGARLVASERGDFSFESGYSAGLALLRATARPDAIFCCNDAMALGAIDAARHTLDLKVPDDMSIIGFDDIPMAAWPCFSLTTLRNPVDDAVENILNLLRRRIGHPHLPPEIRLLRPIMVRRSSARLALP